MTVAFSNDGRSVISGSWDKTVRIWEVQSGRERVVLRGHEDAVYSVALSPDGTRALSGSGDKTVRLWDAQSGVELATLRGHEGKIRCVTFSPDGRNVISGSSDKTVRLWDTGFGRERFVLHGHGDEVMRVVFSFDGTRIFSSAHDNTVRIWDAHSGECLEILRGVTDIDALAVQPNRFPWRAMVRNEETVVEPVTGGSPIARFPDHLRYLTRHPQEAVWIGGVNSQLVLVRLERSGDLVSGLSQTDSDSQAASLILDHK